ncbi:MAG: hypothetical protein RJB26_1074, partial [Pseudomonadota bacterium]
MSIVARGVLYLAAAIALLGPWGMPSAQPVPLTATESLRTTIPLVGGWRFKLDPARTGPESVDFDDSTWLQVNVPHSWNRVGRYLPDPQTHLNGSENIDKTMGIGWYRLR